MRIHSDLGPGLLESAYESCLYYECLKSNLFAERQKPVPLIYIEVKDAVAETASSIVETVGEKLADAKEAIENKAQDIQKNLLGS